MKMNKWEYENEFYRIGRKLDRWHSLFSQFWLLGEPKVSEEINTAAVSFNRKDGGYIQFLFNPNFWDGLKTDFDKEFVICHEILHVFQKHGVRGKDIPLGERQIANIAMDIEINEALLDRFQFPKSLSVVQDPIINGKHKIILCERTFKPEDNVQKNREYEYYFDLLKQNCITINIQIQGAGAHPTLDQHNTEDQNNPGGFQDIPEAVLDGIIDAIRDSLSDEENRELKNWGVNQRFKKYQQKTKKMRARRAWEKLVSFMSKPGESTDDNWVHEDRRHMLMGKDLFLPGKHEQEIDNQKVNLWFFQDISGSCVHLIDHFWSASKTFPEEKFLTTMFTFDTQVQIVSKNQHLSGGGGTCFQCIDNFIQQKTKDKKVPYPDAVFIFTDGEAGSFTCHKPDKWFWFLEGRCMKSSIPDRSHIFYLKDFVGEIV